MMFGLLLLCLGHCLPAVSVAQLYIDAVFGDTIMLPCNKPKSGTQDVNWIFNDTASIGTDKGKWCEKHHYVNRTQPGSFLQSSFFFLVITDVKKVDGGTYKCRVNGDTENEQVIHLRVKGDGNQEVAETPHGAPGSDPVCRPYIEREISLESKTPEPPHCPESKTPEPPHCPAWKLWLSAMGAGIICILAVLGAPFIYKKLRRDEDSEKENNRGNSSSKDLMGVES